MEPPQKTQYDEREAQVAFAVTALEAAIFHLRSAICDPEPGQNRTYPFPETRQGLVKLGMVLREMQKVWKVK